MSEQIPGLGLYPVQLQKLLRIETVQPPRATSSNGQLLTALIVKKFVLIYRNYTQRLHLIFLLCTFVSTLRSRHRFKPILVTALLTFCCSFIGWRVRNAAHFVQSMGPTWTLWQMECTRCYRIQITVSAGEGSKKRTLETAGEPQLMPGASPSEVAKCFLSWNFLVGTCWYKFLHSGAWSWRGSSDIAPIAKNTQSQAGKRAEAQAAGGVTPLQRCWMHPKPQELGSEKTKLNWDGKEIQTSPGCVHSGYSFFHSALQSRSNDAVIIQAWLCL